MATVNIDPAVRERALAFVRRARLAGSDFTLDQVIEGAIVAFLDAAEPELDARGL